MKKIVKLFILICVCFIPMMVDAKANFEFKDDYDNKMFFNEENGEYFYLDKNKSINETNNVVVYAKNGNFLRRDSFFDEDIESSPNAITSSKYFDSYYKLYLQNQNVLYDEENDILYDIDYYSEYLCYYDSDNSYIEKGFNDDLEFTKRLLGKKYDVYLKIKENDVKVRNVVENNGYYLVYYRDLGYNYFVSVFDKSLKMIKTFEIGESDDICCLYIYDDLIYVMTSPNMLDVYKIDGSLLETLTVNHDFVGTADDLLCGDLAPYMLYIKNNELFIMYGPKRCEKRVESDDFFMEKVNADSGVPDFLTLVYSLNYDVNKVESSNGDFTYESKFDDEGREFVELKISPLKGYSVEDIIVTDINGRRIDVTNNKFYMPTSDVRVEVKFGEYIPIPDTFSNISLTIIVISILLIGCGIGIMCFSLRFKNIK